MTIGLISVDGHSGFPNLALMRLSAYHKARGDIVEWWDGFTHYDRVYILDYRFAEEFSAWSKRKAIVLAKKKRREQRKRK